MAVCRRPFVYRLSLSPESFVFPNSAQNLAAGVVRVVFGTTVNVNAANFNFVGLQDGPNDRNVAALTQESPSRILVHPVFGAGTSTQILHWGTGGNTMGQTPAGVRVGPFAMKVLF